ncbi:MAG TPA: peptidylprolyl isomerase [Spirochaetia bacterium]|nr:peptidylprolyl isomerase [Spirochaetia bacterium]
MHSREIRRHVSKKKDTGEKEKPQRRNPVFHALTIIILVVVVVSFIGSGLLMRYGGTPRVVFGSYNDREIVFQRGNYMAEQYDIIAQRIKETQQQGSLETQLWQAWRYAFNQTVFHMAILDLAKKSGIWVSNDRVTDSLIESGPYMVNGIFSSSKYEATPVAERNATNKLRRETSIHSQVLEDSFLDQKQSSGEVEFIKAMAARERRFSFVYYDFKDFPLEKVLTYGLGNKEKFRKVKLSRITVTSGKGEAEKIRDMALAGQSSFEDLARSYSKGLYADKGGDMGWQYYYELQTLFDSDDPVQSVFRLKDGEISEVFQSGESYIFFRKDSDVVGPDFKDEELVKTVREYIMSNERGVIEAYYMEKANTLKNKSKEGGFLSASIAEGVFPPKDTDFFPINYGEVFPDKRLAVKGEQASEVFASASTNEDFFLKLFSLKEGEVSDPILLNDRILVIQLAAERSAPKQDLDSMENIIGYLANYSLQSDIQTFLIDQNKLEDNFQEAFFKYIAPRQQ